MSVFKYPALKESSDGYFYVLSTAEFEEYAKFCDCHDFLATPMQKLSILLKETELLKCYMELSKLSFAFAILYHIKFYLFTSAELDALAEWIELNLI